MNTSEFVSGYFAKNRGKVIAIIILCILAIACIFITLGFGVYRISVPDAIMVVIDKLMGKDVNYHDELYIWDARLPRGILAVVVGAGLALCGVVMQNVMHNPMAEPYTMGVSSGAFFGVVISMVFNVSIVPWFGEYVANIANAFICALIPVAVILLITMFKKLTSTAMILVGIALLFLFSSITQMILLSASAETLAQAYSWRVGSLSNMSWSDVAVVTPIVILVSILIFTLSRKLDMMYMGDRNAQTVGINPNAIRIISMTLVSVMTATVVCFTGTIGFIGLVAPHVARMIVGSVNKYLMPFSMAFGAFFLVAADTVAKVSGANGLPVGVISSLVGGPMFVYILIKRGKKVWS
ncbi:iron ABC transporter permease protein [methanogenic archaeon mixed culture ISO4-G1]|nr:iron ABC transporter permease protein [methanogenic archaeon mixed culture ISO4-G1]